MISKIKTKVKISKESICIVSIRNIIYLFIWESMYDSPVRKEHIKYD